MYYRIVHLKSVTLVTIVTLINFNKNFKKEKESTILYYLRTFVHSVKFLYMTADSSSFKTQYVEPPQ